MRLKSEYSTFFNLFRIMGQEGSDLEENIVEGMNIEHNWGRLLLRDLEVGLNNYRDGNRNARLDIIGC